MTVETAEAARAAGDLIVFGAPNALRGGSHFGSPGAADMAAAGLCDLLASDYAYALQRAGTLSGGQQQRVAIAKALVQQPRLVLADEPIASLDPANATRVMEALRAINRKDGITVLVNLHTLDTARAYCDRILAMRADAVVFDGPAAALTDARVREIYGVESADALNERVTSTSLGTAAARPQTPAPRRPPPDAWPNSNQTGTHARSD